MPIEVHCPECQALLRIADENAGRQTRCPSCSAVFTASGSPTPSPAPSPRPPASIDTPNPYAPSSVETVARHQHGSSEWAPRKLTVEEVFSSTWAIFKDQWLMACVAVLIVQGIIVGCNMAQSVVLQIVAQVANEPWAVFLAQLVMGIGFGLLQMWLQIGQIMVMFDIARGREIKLGKVFAGGPFLVNTVLAVIMVSMIIFAVALVLIGVPAAAVGLATQDGQAAAVAAIVGMLIAIVPIAILSLIFSQIQMLIIDRGIGAVESLHTSYEITNGNKFTILIIYILLGLIGIGAMILGLLALCIGIIPAMIGVGGYGSLLIVVMYLSMTGQRIAVPGDFISPGPAV